MPPNHLFFICCCLISLSLGQEALFPSTNKTTIHIGFRVIDPKPKTLFHLKGSEILTCFDPFSSRFKSANYLTGETLNAREILFRPSHVSYYKNDLFAIIDQNTFALKVYNLRYSTLFDTNVILNFGESFSVLVNSFIDKDILIAYGKTFISIVNLKTNYIVTTMKSSDLDIKALNYYPEKRKIITVNGDSLVTWNLICDCEKGSITKNATLSENNGNYSAFIERIPDSQNYLSYDQKEKRIMIWNLANLTLAQNISIANVCQNNLDQIKVIDEVLLLIICDKTNIIIFDISTQKILYNTINSSKIIEATVIKDNNFKSVAFLNELGNINILYLNKYVWSTTLFYEKYPQIGDIIDITYLSFYNLNSFQNNETAGYMAIRSNTPDNKTLHIINSYTEKYIGNLTFAEEIKKIIKIGYTDIFLVWFGNEIHSYNQTTIELIWNYKDINFNIDIVDFALYGDPEKDLLPKNNIIIIYSRDNASIKILNSDDGLLISNYILPEKIKDIKFFCMLNTFDSVLYFTQIGNFVNITFDSMTNTTSSQELNDHMDNVLRCKNNLLNYGDKKIEYFNDKFLKVVDPQITDYYYNSSISSITALSSGNFLYYQTNNSFAKIMTNNFQKALLNINEAYINNHFKESILLYNKRFHLTGYYFNEKESFETLFESHCDKLLQSTLMGICLKNDCDCLIDDYSTELISECSEDSYIIDNYLGSQSKGCRKCRMNIENCLACSSETNCKQCDKNYFQVPSKDDKNSSSFCLSFETISNLQNLKNFTGSINN